MNLHVAPSVLDMFEFILLDGNMNNNQLTNDEKQKLIKLVQNYNDEQILTLAIEFAGSYNIYLHFIAFHQGKFQIINEYSFPDRTKQRQQAFIVLNGDFTVCGALCVSFKNQTSVRINLKRVTKFN
jgi:hypothetical protein